MKRDDDLDDSMDIGDSNSSGPLLQRRSNFGAVSNGFNRNVAGMDHCKPGSVKKLVIKNLKGIYVFREEYYRCLHCFLSYFLLLS
jgi:hypothetical protein